MLDEFFDTILDGKDQNLENAQDDEGFVEANEKHKNLKCMIGGNNIIQLKSNSIPKGLIPLEKLFDQNDVAKTPTSSPMKMIFKIKTLGQRFAPK